MFEGIRLNAQAMKALITQQEVISNNLANLNTTGFRKDTVAFRNVLDSAQAAQIETTTVPDQKPGPIRQTGNPLHFAISGSGYFSLQTPEGIRYTRNGSFQVDASGSLVDSQGHVVLSDNGPIVLEDQDSGSVTVELDGRISVGEKNLGRLALVEFSPNASFRKVGLNHLQLIRGGTQLASGRVLQGQLEGSNTNAVQQMVEMMQTVRLFESNQKAVQIQDDTLARAIQQMGSPS